MNSLTRRENKWNPLREMEDIQNRMMSLFDNTFGRLPMKKEGGEEKLTFSEWAPLVDISEDENTYCIKAELPEVKKEDLSVTVENGVLTITGDRKFEKEEKGRKYHRVERGYGKFSRSFGLPDDADSSNVNAEFKNGILTLNVAKSEKAKPKAIDVKVT